MRLLTLVGAVAVLFSGSGATSRAEDTNASPTPTPAPAASPAAPVAASPTPAAAKLLPSKTAWQALKPTSTTRMDPRLSLGFLVPGHNGWMMTCSALVLFMTLPGLALFYGGLVRQKNVLSVLAQCFGITGMVTILWWAFGYSLVFGKSFNNPFYRRIGIFFPLRGHFRPEYGLCLLGIAECLRDVPADVRYHHACPHRGRDR